MRPPGDFGLDPTAPTLDRPPGNFSPPPAVVQPAAAANDARSIEPTAAQCCAAPPWGCWSQVPRDPDLIRDLGPWCLEIFSGSAGLSSQWRLHGLQVLPPIDVTRSDTVQEPTDILDAEFFSFVLLLCRMGAVAFLHLGTPMLFIQFGSIATRWAATCQIQGLPTRS